MCMNQRRFANAAKIPRISSSLTTCCPGKAEWIAPVAGLKAAGWRKTQAA